MNSQQLIETAQGLVGGGKGLLAMDESNPTCNKRFAPLGIPQTEASRRAYRELIVTSPGLGESISGAILYDESIRQKTSKGMSFVDVLVETGIIPGIKVDTGAKEMAGFPGEKVTEGLDGLPGRVQEYVGMGARFAKWRAVIAIGTGIPTEGCIEGNAHALARYAAICQQAGLVPIVEPEVLMNGSHDFQHCLEITGRVLHAVFNQLHVQRVLLEGMILKPNMVLPGKDCPHQDGVEQVADATVRCLLRSVPAAVGGIAFLSGGQPGELACTRLNAMNVRFASKMPWALTFSFARAIQHPGLDIWSGHDASVKAAQKSLLHRAKCSRAARCGEYSAVMEKT
ncbi:MAG TPA: class I fructose-bisphosphate aldolase [Tepidisphaeraceae bacterium]|nr:class I fructose-bisphosphate aldolase [Tepidisphaeraceae bacterium]